MFYEQFIKDDIINLGGDAFDFYIQTYNSMPSCKKYLFNEGEDYENCNYEKMVCSYDKTRSTFHNESRNDYRDHGKP
jgi:hypothetical protein